MARFQLDPEHVSQIEQLLYETGEIVNQEATRARDGVIAAQGAINGYAAVAAANKQEEFGQIAARLHTEIAQMSEALGLSRQAVAAQDEMDMQEFVNINYEDI